MTIEMSVEFLAGLLGKPVQEFEAALKADEEGNLKSQGEIQSLFKSEFSDRLKQAKSAGKKEGKGWGERETRDQVEAELSKLLKVDSGNLEDMVETYTSRVLEASKKELTPEEIKASDVYKQAVKAEREKLASVQGEFDQYKKQVSTRQKKSVVKSQLQKILEAKNFKLPTDQQILEQRMDLLLDRMFSGNDFQVTEDGRVTVLDDKGEVVQDEMFNPVPFSDWSTKKALLVFDQAEGDGRTSPGNTTQVPGQAPGKFSFPQVQSTEQFFQELDKMEDLDKKEAFQKHFETLQERGLVQN